MKKRDVLRLLPEVVEIVDQLNDQIPWTVCTEISCGKFRFTGTDSYLAICWNELVLWDTCQNSLANASKDVEDATEPSYELCRQVIADEIRKISALFEVDGEKPPGRTARWH